MNESCDLIIVGGGIVGLATAMALSRRVRARIVLIEAERKLASHQTGNNSGVIHSGLYYRPGSLKAKNCVEGRQAMVDFCRKRGIRHELCGKLVVAVLRREIPLLDELERRGRKNGLRGIRRLTPSQLRDHEPFVAGVAGLHVPETGIVDYRRVAAAMAEAAGESGVRIELGRRFLDLRRSTGSLQVQTSTGGIEARFLVNCGGLQCDRIARRCGAAPGIRIVPFRGEYYRVVPSRRRLVRNPIYPVPDPDFPFLGVHFTRLVDGGVEAGPNAVLAFCREGYRKSDVCLKDTVETFTYPGFLRLAARYWRAGLGEVHRSASKSAFVRALRKLVPAVSAPDLVSGGAGVRAQALTPGGRLLDDFCITGDRQTIHVLNAPSPAATASISIGRRIAEMAARRFDIRQRSKA